MFSWLAKWRSRVISRRARLASWILSKTRVTSLTATVSPDILSAADLCGEIHLHCVLPLLVRVHNVHYDTVGTGPEFPDERPSSLDGENLAKRRVERMIASVYS